MSQEGGKVASTKIGYEILSWIGYGALGTGAAMALSGAYVNVTQGIPLGIGVAVAGVVLVGIAMFLKKSKKEVK